MDKESFWSLACSKRVAPRALRVALLVGTILALINHGDKMLAMSLGSEDTLKIALTYLVPYGVSTWSAVLAIRAEGSSGT